MAPQRITKGQSPDGTDARAAHAGWWRWHRAFMVTMLVTMFLTAALIGSVRADEPVARATAELVARAQIVSGVRVMREELFSDHETPSRRERLPKPRERPCPETDPQPCRMIVVDLP